jgi:uncharacterized protein (DUF2345 family)
MSEKPNNKSIILPGGRSLEIAEEAKALHIHGPQGEVEIEIELRDTGPIVRVRAAALQVETRGELSLSCERFEVRARDSIQLASQGDIRVTSDGDLAASVRGDVDVRASGHAHWEGKAVRIRARRGEAQIEASDEVRIEGERVLLNS